MKREDLIKVLQMHQSSEITTEEACIMIDNGYKYNAPIPEHIHCTCGCVKTE